MYKIQLYDYNSEPIFDEIAIFFAEDIEDFQEKWFALEEEKERKERFLRSKAGEIVIDYYSNAPELNVVQYDAELNNIVQYDNGKDYGEKDVKLEDITFESRNAYDWPSKFHVNRWSIHFRWIAFRNEYYRIASYLAEGVCMIDTMFQKGKLRAVKCFGNPVLLNDIAYAPKYSLWVDEKDWPNPSYSDFNDNKLQTICYLHNKSFEDEKELLEDMENFKVTEEVLDWLFADVVGEAG